MFDEMFQLSFIFLKVIKFSNVFFRHHLKIQYPGLTDVHLKKKKSNHI